MKNAFPAEPYLLGLDVGTNSIGWALLAVEEGRPARLAGAGVRVFAAGVEGDISSGRDESRAKARREARLRRRMLERRRGRLDKLALLLQEAGLLPPGDLGSPDAAATLFADLDRSLFPQPARRSDPHVLPYRLRARALDERLTPHELGRALYHLAQRRGFASNRRTLRARAGEQDERSVVKRGISNLAQEMEASGARTLGEYLSRLDPTEERIRQRYTDRRMFQDEFERIWTAQAPHHPQTLTEDLKTRISQAIFFQRPLKSQKRLIGHCELEPRSRRAPLALLAYQRFRLLQKVNDLEIITPDGECRKPTPDERAKLLDALESRGDLTFAQICRRLKLPEHHFNFESEAEKKLVGNRTATKLAKVFDQRWATLAPAERDAVVEDLLSIQNQEALRRRATRVWGLDDDAAAQLAEVALEDGYCSLSRKALARILPLMEQGMPYATARKELYGEQRPIPAAHVLPRLARTLQVRNPAVERALTELRKLVNAIVREHGKPAHIRIELARDLKKPRKERKLIATRNQRSREAREQAAKRLLEEAGITSPRRSDIEKWLLADECGWRCPYTGRQFGASALFGDSPQFDVEHIVPLSRCLDDSFYNKTLCEIAENRTRKGNRTPWEAYGSDPARWEQIIGRLKQFHSHAARAKLERFQMTEADLESFDDFVSRQLNDTRYASRLAVEFLSRLYGAGADGVDPEGRHRVQAGRGQVTYFLRNEWGLNAILGDGGEKSRDDHRHHAVDAVAVALTDAATVKRLSDAAARAVQERRRRFGKLEAPWSGFLDDVRAAVEAMVVSHRVSRKVAGAMHEETYYSKPHTDPNGKPCVHVRKPVAKLSAKDLTNIVDPVVQQRVRDKLQELGEQDPASALAAPENHPALVAKDGRNIPIHTVRVRVYESTTPVGAGARQRWVKLGSNHHIEILETTDRRGHAHWDGVVVSTYEAMRRLRAGEPVVQRDHGPGKQFKFSLAAGETIEIDDGPNGKRGLYVVEKVTKRGQGKNERATVGIVSISDARKSTGKEKDKVRELKEPSSEVLRDRHCCKVVITPLGEVRRAND